MGERARKAPLEHFLGLFSEVRAGEGPVALLLLLELFVLMVAYYLLKTAREPLIILGSGAEWKSYAAGAQAVLLIGFVPLYAWFSSRVERRGLLVGFHLFIIVAIELFYFWLQVDGAVVGIAFYIWLGVFSVSVVAQFWSLANDLYPLRSGERLFPVIGIGASCGAPLGAKLAEWLAQAGFGIEAMLQLAALALVLSLTIALVVLARDRAASETTPADSEASLAKGSGFALVLRSRYLTLMMVVLIILNLVNTTGEFILGKKVQLVAETLFVSTGARERYIGSFYGGYYFYVNLATLVLQAVVVSRIIKYGGMGVMLLALPTVALGAYGIIAAGAGLTAIRWAKTAENAVNYSVMNTGRAMLWLPTTREQKYQAKQAVDTFFVRIGDLLSAGLVFAGTNWLRFNVQAFAWANVIFVAGWVLLAYRLVRTYRALAPQHGES